MVKDSTLQMRISAELKEQAVKIASARGESLSEFIETWLQGEIERHAPCSVCGTWLPLEVLEGFHPWEFECRECMEEIKESDYKAEQDSRAVLWGFKEGYKDGWNRFEHQTPKDPVDATENVMMWIGYREGYREGREAAGCPGGENNIILASNNLQGLTADDRPLQPAQAAILRQLCHAQDNQGRVSRHALYAAADLNDPDPNDNNRGLRRVLGSITQRLNSPDWYSSVGDPTAPGGRWYLLRKDLRDELCEILTDLKSP